MHLEKEFDVRCPPERAGAIAALDDTLLGLFPDTKTEIVASRGSRKTTRTEFTALGHSGTVTFHFDFLDDGDIAFEKVCDGNVWKQLMGKVSFRERRGGTRVRITMDGKTRGLVPEFTIKGPMRDQIDQMARGLRERLEDEGAADA